MINAESGQMKVTTRPAERSSVVLEVEFPPERVRRSVDESVRHLARRTKVPGFRPGKIPRPVLELALGIRREDPDGPNPLYDDAKEHLFEHSVIEALKDSELDVLSIPAPEWLTFQEGAGASYRVTLPLRPQVKLGAYSELSVRDHRSTRSTTPLSTRSSSSYASSRPRWCLSRVAVRRPTTTRLSAS